MIKPDETNNVVERLRKYCDEYEDAPNWGGPTMYPKAPSVKDLRALLAERQSLSDRIDVLEGDKRAIVEWLRYHITDEAAEYKTVFAARLASAIEAGDYRLASLTQGGKNDDAARR